MDRDREPHLGRSAVSLEAHGTVMAVKAGSSRCSLHSEIKNIKPHHDIFVSNSSSFFYPQSICSIRLQPQCGVVHCHWSDMPR